MRVIRINEASKATDRFTYYPISDIHAGDPGFDEVALRRLVKRIEADDRARWSFGGDAGEFITPKDPRFQWSSVDERYRLNIGRIPDATKEHVVDLFRPIASKCWFWGIGNHEQTIHNRYDRGIGAEIASELGVPSRYIGYKGFAWVKFFRKTGSAGTGSARPLLIDYHHGWQGGRGRGAFHNEAEKLLGHSNADIIVRGHSHKQQAEVLQSFKVGTKAVALRQRVVACCGTFKHSHEIHHPILDTGKLSEVKDDDWAERKGFRPEDPLGPPIIEIHLSHGQSAGDIQMTFDVRLGVSY